MVGGVIASGVNGNQPEDSRCNRRFAPAIPFLLCKLAYRVIFWFLLFPFLGYSLVSFMSESVTTYAPFLSQQLTLDARIGPGGERYPTR